MLDGITRGVQRRTSGDMFAPRSTVQQCWSAVGDSIAMITEVGVKHLRELLRDGADGGDVGARITDATRAPSRR